MTYKVLAIKWRPKKFDEIIGQEHITKSLKNAIKHNRISHAFTFSGPRGVGKTTTARILAMELNKVEDLSSSFDIIEMDAASNRGIDEIRSLRENVAISPAHGKYKIYIIDEVHMLTKEAFNALLKTLEEPPEHVIFILATTDPYKMPATILSRTQRYDFRRLSISNIVEQFKIILKEDNIEYNEGALKLIARKADGSMRDGLGFLDQVLNYSEKNVSLENVQSSLGVINDQTYMQILDSIYKKNVNNVITLTSQSINSGTAIEDFIADFNIFLRNVLYSMISRGNNEISVIADWVVNNSHITQMEIVRLMDLLLQFEVKSKFSKQSNLALEVLMVKLCNLDSIIDISSLISNGKQILNNSINENDKTQKSVNANENIVKEKKVLEDSNYKNISSNEKSIDDSISIDKIDVKNNSEEFDKTKIKEKIPEIISLIEKENSKTASFMNDIEIDSIDNDEIKIIVNNLSNFIYDTLIKDVKLIKKAFNIILDSNHKIVLSRGTEMVLKSEKNKKKNKDKDHPLFMQIIEKFDGQVIK